MLTCNVACGTCQAHTRAGRLAGHLWWLLGSPEVHLFCWCQLLLCEPRGCCRGSAAQRPRQDTKTTMGDEVGA